MTAALVADFQKHHIILRGFDSKNGAYVQNTKGSKVLAIEHYEIGEREGVIH